jgi:hypothetical protein
MGFHDEPIFKTHQDFLYLSSSGITTRARQRWTFLQSTAYNCCMAAVFKLMALANIAAMALPLGWCCPMPAAVSAGTSSASAAAPDSAPPAACPNCHPLRAPAGERVPSAPSLPDECPCCQVRATTSADSLSIAPAAEPWVPLIATIERETLAGFDRQPGEPIRFPGPPLQILHCIWRC